MVELVGWFVGGGTFPPPSLWALLGDLIMVEEGTLKKTREELVTAGAVFDMSKPVYPSLSKPFETASLDGRTFMASSDGQFLSGTPYENWKA